MLFPSAIQQEPHSAQTSASLPEACTATALDTVSIQPPPLLISIRPQSLQRIFS